MKSIWVLINDESLNWEQFSFVKATHWFVDSRVGPLSRNEWNRQCFPGVCNAFFLLAFGFVLNQLPGILLFICQVQFPSDFTQNSNVESPEINYLPCSISTALPLQAFTSLLHYTRFLNIFLRTVGHCRENVTLGKWPSLCHSSYFPVSEKSNVAELQFAFQGPYQHNIVDVLNNSLAALMKNLKLLCDISDYKDVGTIIFPEHLY